MYLLTTEFAPLFRRLTVCMTPFLLASACGSGASDNNQRPSALSSSSAQASGAPQASASLGGQSSAIPAPSATSPALPASSQPTASAPRPTASAPAPSAPAASETTPAASTAGVPSASAPPTGGMPPGTKGSSAGCGTPATLESGRATIDVEGSEREYILRLPDNYDPMHPYKLIFGLHWRGGQASDVSDGTIGLGDYYGLADLADESVIFVSPEGLDQGWANSGNRDIKLMRAIMARFEADLCIDLDRIFSVGFSFGGMMSFAIACEMADVFRAVAPLSGALYSGCGNGTEPIALWGAHGTSDTVVPIEDGRAGLEEVLERNHCGAQTMPVDPSPCVTYQGCDEGYPVTWCEFDGGHGPQGWQVQPIWDFFSQF